MNKNVGHAFIALGLAAAALIGVSIGTQATADPTPAVGTFNIVMAVAVADPTSKGDYNEYVLDRGLTLGDCVDALKGHKFNVRKVQNVTIVQTFACERGGEQ